MHYYTVAEKYLIKSVSVSHWAQRFQLDHGGGAPHCGVAWVVSGAISRTSTITSGVLGYTMEWNHFRRITYSFFRLDV